MSKLGAWSNFVDLAEMTSWYQELPGGMAAEYAHYQPRPGDFRSHPNFAKLRRETIKFVDKSIKPFKPASHTPQLHFEPVRANGMDAARLYARRHPELAPLINVVLEYFELALYSHDAGHCACTFRKDAPRGLFMPNFGTDVSAEWVTSFAVNEFLREEAVPLPARLFQVGVHWSSTFGGTTDKGIQLGLPTPKPRTFWGAAMRTADICPTKKDTVRMWLEGSVALLYGEVPSVPIPRRWKTFVDRELDFIGYCRHTMQHLDRVAGFALCAELGWYARLDKVVEALKQLYDRRSPAARYTQKEMKKFGVTLP